MRVFNICRNSSEKMPLAGQTLPALRPSSFNDPSAAAGAHAGKETVSLFPSAFVRIVCCICAHLQTSGRKVLK